MANQANALRAEIRRLQREQAAEVARLKDERDALRAQVQALGNELTALREAAAGAAA